MVDQVDRTPTAFGDLRGWIDALRAEDELLEVNSEVDWDVELGTIVRMGQGTGQGPAFLFNNIKDYNGPDAVSGQVFTGGQGSYSRLAMMFGLPRDTPQLGPERQRGLVLAPAPQPTKGTLQASTQAVSFPFRLLWMQNVHFSIMPLTRFRLPR